MYGKQPTMKEQTANISLLPNTKAKRVSFATILYTDTDNNQVYKYRDTAIVTITPDGKTILNSGGWRTMTTKEKMDTYATPYRIYQRGGLWYVCKPDYSQESYDNAWSNSVPFYDGIILPDALSPDNVQNAKEQEAKQKLRLKQIKKFVSQITADNLPLPDSGDCWLCSLFQQTTTEENGQTHISNHIDENYMHGSLIVLAYKYFGRENSLQWVYSAVQRGQAASYHVQDVRRTVSRFLKRMEGLG